MTLTIELSPDEEAALSCAAEAKGMAPDEYARRVLAGELGRAAQRIKNQAAIELLHRWREEAAAMSDEEAQEAEIEWREMMRDLDEHRESPRKLFPTSACLMPGG